MAQEKFKSKGGFIIASIGAAVGLGNALRFPGLCAKYGGGAFLLIYFAALVLLGIPLLNAEIALGRKHGGGAPKCFGALGKGGGILGWASCFNSMITALIYAGLAGWIIATAVNIVPLSLSAPELSQNQISGHFFDKVLCARADGALSGISPLVLACILAACAMMFFCLKGGANTLSKTAKFAVAIPVILLVIMAVRGLMYDNSAEALSALFLPDFSKLSSPELWLSALGQVFFSLSVSVGIMPAFGAFLPERTNVFSCSLFITFADFSVSVLSSVVLFTTLYGCGLQEHIGQSGIITAFAVYPVAITSLFGQTALNAIVGLLFYVSLAMMAIQSAVSMAEAFLSPFSEAFGIKKKVLAGIICAIGAVICSVYATTSAVMVTDVSDKFINFYNILILGIAECVIIGMSRDLKTLADEVNRYTGKLKIPRTLFKISIKYFSPAVLLSLTAFEAVRLILHGLAYPIWAQIAFGWGLSAIVFITGILLEYLSKMPRPYAFKRSSKRTV